MAVSDSQAILDGLRASVKLRADDMEAALAFAEALAPEHLQLAGEAAEALAPRVRSAGCLFVGNASGTAFGDYVAGSNHTLPTEGAARFASGLQRAPLPAAHGGGARGRRARAPRPAPDAPPGVPTRSHGRGLPADADDLLAFAARLRALRQNPRP